MADLLHYWCYLLCSVSWEGRSLFLKTRSAELREDLVESIWGRTSPHRLTLVAI